MNSRNERRVMMTDMMGIKRIINEYNNQLYAHRLDNLDEMHQFPEGDNLSKLTEEIDNLNSSI